MFLSLIAIVMTADIITVEELIIYKYFALSSAQIVNVVSFEMHNVLSTAFRLTMTNCSANYNKLSALASRIIVFLCFILKLHESCYDILYLLRTA